MTESNTDTTTTTTDTDDSTDFDIDYLCWYVVSHLDHYAWPDEYAADEVAGLAEQEANGVADISDATIARERRHAIASFMVYSDIAEVLARWIDVYARADHYRERNGLSAFETLTAGHFAQAPDTGVTIPDRSPMDIGAIRDYARDQQEQGDTE